MQLPPVEVIATWPQPNYANPSEVRGPAIFILTLIFVPLLFILVSLRTYTRLRLSKNFGPDDIVILLAVFPTLGCATITLLAVRYYGWSRHVWDVPPDQLVLGLKVVIAVEVLFSVACSLTKLSMLLLINRVMAGGIPFLKTLSMAVMALVCVEMFIFCVVVINTCNPVSDYWTLSLAPQQCINEAVHVLIAGIINTVTDFCVVLIPIPVVLKLRLPLRQRIFCSMLFGAGFVVCIAGAIRIYYTHELNTTYDKTWLAFPTWISGTVELYLGIIATSIPAIKPFVSRYFPRILGSNSNNSNTSSSALYHSNIHSSKTATNLHTLDSYVHKPSLTSSSNSAHSRSSLLLSTSSTPADANTAPGSSPTTSIFPIRIKLSRKNAPVPLTPVLSAFSTYTLPSPASVSLSAPEAIHEKEPQPPAVPTAAQRAAQLTHKANKEVKINHPKPTTIQAPAPAQHRLAEWKASQPPPPPEPTSSTDLPLQGQRLGHENSSSETSLSDFHTALNGTETGKEKSAPEPSVSKYGWKEDKPRERDGDIDLEKGIGRES